MTTNQTETPIGVDPRRWLALVVIAVAQLIVVLDASIVNIALPSAQDALGISDANRQWVVTAYALAFGGLLRLRRPDRRLRRPQARLHHRPRWVRRGLRSRWPRAEPG